jgi:DNA-directed RNA polymerase subunit RPC12/RpoP
MSDSAESVKQFEVEVSVEESGSVPVEAESAEAAREKVESWAYDDIARHLGDANRETKAVYRLATDGGEDQGQAIHRGLGKFECLRCGRTVEFYGRPSGRECADCGYKSWILHHRKEPVSFVEKLKAVIFG